MFDAPRPLSHPLRQPTGTRILAVLLFFMGALPAALAAPPPEVTGVGFSGSTTLTWASASGANDYNVYRGLGSQLRAGVPLRCHGDEIAATVFATPAVPPSGDAYLYLVTAESNLDGEGTAGVGSNLVTRSLLGTCAKVMRNHLLDRTGYGGDEWSRARLAALGIQGYLNEQLNPASIDEASNTELNARRAAIGTLDRIGDLQALDLVNAVYARRQLEQQAAMFWNNHFNTDYREINGLFNIYQACTAYTDCITYPDCCNLTRGQKSTELHYRDLETFRDLAFNGSFREIVEASALGPAMIIYLDTNANVRSAPNENFARELLELHSMGVTGGYTQQDIVELARVFSGWNVCKKTTANAGDPLAACIPNSQIGQVPPTPANKEPVGAWVANFRPNQHDNGQKILFQGTPYETIIPATATNSPLGINDVFTALDAIADHPSTARFISTKLLQRFVTESPPQTMVDAAVAEWNDAGNPHGQGDLREVLRAVLAQAAFLDPDRARAKIKTPFEHVASSLRALRGKTDGSTGATNYIGRMQEPQHLNAVPTGYSELGGDWVDTGNLLERQNWGLDLTSRTNANYGTDLILLLTSSGIVISPGTAANAPPIVDFLADVLFGGAITPAERQAAITYLTTNDSGAPSNFTDSRIRETAGFMLGFAQFCEQ